MALRIEGDHAETLCLTLCLNHILNSTTIDNEGRTVIAVDKKNIERTRDLLGRLGFKILEE